jgi:hypothetical protein
VIVAWSPWGGDALPPVACKEGGHSVERLTGCERAVKIHAAP